MDELHEILIDMAQDIHHALVAESIDYWMVGGGSIGLKRTGELVPWDDDIDFVFLRKDTAIVERALIKHLSDRYIVERMNSPENHKSYIRVVKRGTCLIRNVHDKNAMGISVELFPMIGVAGSGFRRKLCLGLTKGLILLNMAGDYVPGPLRMLVIASEKVIGMMYDRIATEDGNPFWAPLNGCFFNQIVDKTYFGRPTAYDMCGRTLNFPEHLESYLESVFGDYMRLPPEECRVPTYLVLDTHDSWEPHLEEARRIQYSKR